MEIARNLKTARDDRESGHLTNNTLFGQWCVAHGFGDGDMDSNERGALITMAAHPEAMRTALENSPLWYIRKILAANKQHFDETHTNRARSVSSRNPETSPQPAPPAGSVEETLIAAIRAARATAPVAVTAGQRLNESLLAQAGALLILDQHKHYAEVEELTGLSNVVLRVAVGREEGHREERAEPLIDPQSITLSQRAQRVLRQEEHRLAIEHQQAMLAIEETIRQRVIAGTAERLARLHEREQAANRTEATYRRMTENRNHPFTPVQFTAILRCLHPDSREAVSAERLQEAFRLFNAKKLQLTGQE
jgi:hypothetical protein